MESPPAVAGRQGTGRSPGVFQTGAQPSALDTPTSPSPRHSLYHTTARGDSQTHLQASSAAPLAEPVLRLQDGEIILEEAHAVSPAAVHGEAPIDSPLQQHNRWQQQSQQRQQQHTPLHSQAADYSSSRELTRPPTHSQEQLLVASFSATAVAQPSFAQNTIPSGAGDPAAALGLPNGGDRRAQQGEAAADDDAATSSEQTSRLRHRPTLTQENVTHMQKLEQYSTREDPTERMWRWLEQAGPPYDSSPSVGIPAKGTARGSGSLGSGGSRKDGGARLWCFACFGGGRR